MSDDRMIHEVLQDLPKSSLTTRLLGVLDSVVPGEWRNITSFEEMIQDVTGETDSSLIQQVGERAIALYANPDNGYQRAVSIYRLLDDTGGLAGTAALANKLGDSVGFLSFLSSVTPKADTTQAVDAGLKLVGELAAFCYSAGIPGDSVGDFATSLANASKEDSMRLAAWLAFDCILPLGPDFLSRTLDMVSQTSEDFFASHPRFQRIAGLLPGASAMDQKALVTQNLDAARGAVESFAANRSITRESIWDRVKHVLEVADDKLDYVSAAIDMSTSYFEHTGIQSVARRVVSRAYGEL